MRQGSRAFASLLLAVLWLSCFPRMALAVTAPAEETLERLRALVEAQAAELEELRNRVQALEDHGTPPPTRVRWQGAPELATADGRLTAKSRGRVMADAWAASSDTPGVDHPGGTTLRAGRLGIEGQLDPAFAYKLEVDFAADGVTVKDAYLQYGGLPGWRFTFGNQKPPFSLEHMTGLPRTTFMERALPNAFAIPESLGASAARVGDGWTLSAALFGETTGTELDADEGHGLAGRLTMAPVRSGNGYLHLGVSAYRRQMGPGAGAGFRVRQRPEVRVFSTRLLDTGPLPARSSTAFALEAAAARGPLALQGELMQNRVVYRDRDAALFEGGYLQASWFVTGEHRPYNPASATHGRVRPGAALGAGGWGALELAARYSALDLGDGGIQGGREENFTLGLNWYPTAYTRFALNWVHYDVEGSNARLPYGSPDHRGQAIGARVQVDS